MATNITPDKIAAMSIHQRHDLFKNAKRALENGNAEAVAILKMLEDSHLPYSEDSALKSKDPLAQKIADIAFSTSGTEAMRTAIEEGLPPMAGLDPLLTEALGVDYGPHNMSTNLAGRLAAERMGQKGYKKTGKKAALPSGCTARTAEVMK